MTDLFLSQIADPFRIILLIALFVTMQRTRAATGVLLPLALGAVFVAVLIPLTIAQVPADQLPLVAGVGLVANACWLAIIALAWAIWQRLTAR